MASSLVTVQDGSATAVAVGASNQPPGLNVTTGNTITVSLTDTSGVTGWSLRSVANNLGLADPSWSVANININQSTGVATFTAPAEYGWFVFESEIINASTTPTTRQTFFAVYISAQGSYRVNFPATGSLTPIGLVQLMNGAALLPAGDPNLAFMTAASPTNAEGSGGPTIVALVQLVCKASGVFDWSVSGSAAAAAAADVSTWTVTSQTGTGTPTYTGNGASGVGGQVATAAAGTGIAITAGGGGSLTQYVGAKTVGTAAVGDTICATGTMHNSVSASVVTPFTRGNNVFLVLSYTNSAANRALSNLCLRLSERLYA